MYIGLSVPKLPYGYRANSIFKKRFNVITGLSDHSNSIYSSLEQ